MGKTPTKKILFLLHLPPPIHGSSVVGGYIKSSKLINENFSCTFLNVLASTSISKTGKVSSVKILSLFITLLKLVYTLIIKKPDLCYLALTTTGAAFFKDALFVFVLKIFKVKRIFHLHNKGVARFQHKKIYKLFYKFVFKNAEVIILSILLYDDIKDFVPSKRIHVCPNGIPPLNVTESLYQVEKLGCTILFLSNLIESKGVNVLLKACAILKMNKLNFKCKIIGGEGDISEKGLKSSISDMGLENFVFYEGKKYDNEKQKAFLEADIFAFPTYYRNECFPLVLLEAMKYSLPIVATAEGGISDMVIEGQNGFLTISKDENLLFEKLQFLIKNEIRRRAMGLEGKKKFLNEFTLEKFEQKLSSIIKTCII